MFRTAVGAEPYEYQSRLANAAAWPLAVNVGTGLGKTAAVALAWLWKRRYADESVRMVTPRRLVYCLPQRTLVQQTFGAILGWLDNLELRDSTAGTRGIPVYSLMGGDLARDWDLEPERDAVIVGTQDQLLSRALNRGYSASRYRWPMQFALLNSDVLWVIDEPQIMQEGLPTTAQLQAFRDQLGTIGPAETVWVSATFRKEWVSTVDYRQTASSREVLELSNADRKSAAHLLEASKPVSAAAVSLSSAVAKRPVEYGQALARFVLDKHQTGTTSLVVVNRVNRAQATYEALKKLGAQAELLLVHSRFRPFDRQSLNRHLVELEGRGAIVVATQAVEAGVDFSCRTLVTELAPWASLVQRFGRCNRRGESDGARIYWVDIEADDAAASPYEPSELGVARDVVVNLVDARIAGLPKVEDALKVQYVLRRRDILELFDTTPDLAGADVDVSPFIRSAKDSDVQVFWRSWEGDRPQEEPRPGSDEVCRVGIGDFAVFLGKTSGGRSRSAWWWDPLQESWRRAREDDIVPGQMFLVHVHDGGYSPDLGFAPEQWNIVTPVPMDVESEVPETHDGNDDNSPRARQSSPVTLEQHIVDVENEAERIITAFPGMEILRVLRDAATWHDRGKAAPPFQALLRKSLHVEVAKQFKAVPLAKGGDLNKQTGNIDSDSKGDSQSDEVPAPDESTERRAKGHWSDAPIRGFRHELASVLAYLDNARTLQQADVEEVRLTAYLIASHHGKIRVSIRSTPTERVPPDDRLFARGVWDGDVLPELRLSDGRVFPEAQMDLSLMRSGLYGTEDVVEQSWLEGALGLLEKHGPFRLAWFETMLRVADARASREEAGV